MYKNKINTRVKQQSDAKKFANSHNKLYAKFK